MGKASRSSLHFPMEPGIVTKVNSEHNVEVDGVPRHVCDMSRRWANEGERDDKSLISANLPTVGPNFVFFSSESSFERDAEGRNTTLENGNDVENESLLLPWQGLPVRDDCRRILKTFSLTMILKSRGSVIKG